MTHPMLLTDFPIYRLLFGSIRLMISVLIPLTHITMIKGLKKREAIGPPLMKATATKSVKESKTKLLLKCRINGIQDLVGLVLVGVGVEEYMRPSQHG
jgi:hypothetical protein